MWAESWFRRRRWERRVDSELRFHFESLVGDYMRQGLSRQQAEHRASRDFGPLELAKDECRDTRPAEVLYQVLRDVSYSLRCLLRSPAFSLAVVLTLALGIGANTAVFSVVKGVLLNQLPYRDPERLVALGEADSGETRPEMIGYTTAYDWRHLSSSLERMSLYRNASAVIVDSGEPELVQGMRVGYEFFDTLGVVMQLGRTFLPEEDSPDRRYEVILSDQLWRRRFGADRHILGRILRLSESSFTVVGVLPPSFRSLNIPGSNRQPMMFMPLGYDLSLPFACRDCQHLHLIGRLKPGIPVGQAHAELDAIMADLVKQYPASYPPGASAAIAPLHQHIVGSVSTAIWVTLGAVGLVLLVACANVGNLMLARAADRAPEVALRAALGAPRWRLVCQLLVESLVLALAGGLVGAVMAWWGVSGLAIIGPREIPRLNEVQIDAGTLLFALGISVLTAVLSALMPTASSAGLVLNDALKQLKRSSKIRGYHRLCAALISVELALAFALVTGAGLLGKSLLHLLNVEPGFDPERVLTLRTYLYGARYRKPEAELGYYNQVLQRLRAAPGIENVAMISQLPLSDFDRRGFHVRDRHPQIPSDVPSADTYSVSMDYFRTMKIPLLRGRTFLDSDHPDTPGVAVISEACARQQFPNENALGKQIQLGGRDDRKPWLTVVGIVGDVRHYGLDTMPNIAAYVLQSQDVSFSYSLVARTTGDPTSMERTVRSVFRAVDPTQPLFDVRPMESFLASSLAQRRFTLMLVGLFGILALALAAIGVYGVISYTVSTRTRDFGIRMALGASRRDVATSVLWNGMASIGIGLATGFLLSLALTRFLANLLFEVRPADPATYALVTLLLGVVALLACYLPAYRAANVDPAVSLRHE